jgi:hypothetical protein
VFILFMLSRDKLATDKHVTFIHPFIRRSVYVFVLSLLVIMADYENRTEENDSVT